jgi:hypothetical protein
MLTISDAQLKEAAAIIGAHDAGDEAIESNVAALVKDPLLARRVIDWLPEVFGMVLVSHIDTVVLPTTFSAKDKRGEWVEVPLSAEPIFESAMRLATQMLHDGSQDVFRNIALRSGVVPAAHRALNEGRSLKGATMSGPALLGIPAETYISEPVSGWRKLFRRAPG